MRRFNDLTIPELEEINPTKQELFQELEESFDFALPQQWLNEFAKWCEVNFVDVSYKLIRMTTVMGYGESSFGQLVTRCTEVFDAHELWQDSLSQST